MGATTIAVPAATAEAFAAIYDVTDEEREALRRYVADWSKNSTLLPIKDEEGNFKYIDFNLSVQLDHTHRFLLRLRHCRLPSHLVLGNPFRYYTQ